MNVDEKAKKIWDNVYIGSGWYKCSLAELKWTPTIYTWLKDLFKTEEEREMLHQFLGRRDHAEYLIMQLVRESDEAECLTSSIDFIRDAKLYFIRSKL